jgi:hypothetical protein
MADPISESIDDVVNEVNATIDETTKGCFGMLIFGMIGLLALGSGLVLLIHHVLD